MQPRLIGFAKEAIRIQEDNGYAWRALGRAYLNQKKYDESISALERATKLNPKDAVAWLLVSWCYSSTGQQGKAKEAMTRAEEVEPELIAKQAALHEIVKRLPPVSPK